MFCDIEAWANALQLRSKLIYHLLQTTAVRNLLLGDCRGQDWPENRAAIVLEGSRNFVMLEILRLIRVAIGPLQLGKLAKGDHRALTIEEKLALDRAMEKIGSGNSVSARRKFSI